LHRRVIYACSQTPRPVYIYVSPWARSGAAEAERLVTRYCFCEAEKFSRFARVFMMPRDEGGSGARRVENIAAMCAASAMLRDEPREERQRVVAGSTTKGRERSVQEAAVVVVSGRCGAAVRQEGERRVDIRARRATAPSTEIYIAGEAAAA